MIHNDTHARHVTSFFVPASLRSVGVYEVKGGKMHQQEQVQFCWSELRQCRATISVTVWCVLLVRVYFSLPFESRYLRKVGWLILYLPRWDDDVSDNNSGGFVVSLMETRSGEFSSEHCVFRTLQMRFKKGLLVAVLPACGLVMFLMISPHQQCWWAVFFPSFQTKRPNRCCPFLACSINTFPQLEPLCQVQLSCPWVEALMELLGMGTLRRYIYIWVCLKRPWNPLVSMWNKPFSHLFIIQNGHSWGFLLFQVKVCLVSTSTHLMGLLTSPFFWAADFATRGQDELVFSSSQLLYIFSVSHRCNCGSFKNHIGFWQSSWCVEWNSLTTVLRLKGLIQYSHHHKFLWANHIATKPPRRSGTPRNGGD